MGIKKRLLGIGCIIVAAAASIAFLPGMANAGTVPAAALNNPDVPIAKIRSLPLAAQNDGTVFIDPDFDTSMPLIRPNGKAVPGQSAAKMAAATGCGKNIWGPPTGSWSGEVALGCSVWGYKGATVGYRFTKAINTQANGCASGLGWSGQFNTVKTFYAIGCGSSGSRNGIPWGNSIGNIVGQARSAAMPMGAIIYVHGGA